MGTGVMLLEQHLQRTNGEGREVHKFLDQYFDVMGISHRRIYHHKKGIEAVREKFGSRAAEIAAKHIHDDLYGDMFDGPIPDDERYYDKT